MRSTKPFEDRKLGIAFNRGCCWGMRTITPDDFIEGVNHARGIRGWSQVRDPYGNLFGAGGERVAADNVAATAPPQKRKK